MNRKTKTWVITLAVLLISAILGVVAVKQQLTSAQESLAETELQLQQLQQQVNSLNASVAEQSASIQEQGAELAQKDAEITEKDSVIAQLTQTIEVANSEIAQKNTLITALEAVSAPEGEQQSQNHARLQQDILALGEQQASEELCATLRQAYDVLNVLEQKEQQLQVLPEDTSETALKKRAAASLLQNARNNVQAQINQLQLYVVGVLQGEESAALQSENISTALAEAETQLQAGITAANAAIADAEAIGMNVTGVAALESALSAANAVIEQLNAQIAAGNASIEELQENIAAKEQRIAQLEQQQAENKTEALEEELATLNEELIGLQTALAQEQAGAQELNSRLEQMMLLYQQAMDQLSAYRIAREPDVGQAYTATQADSILPVEANGVTCRLNFTNQSISGRPVVLQLYLGDELLYISQPVEPGASVNTVTLQRALEKGSYSAQLAAVTFDQQGEYAGATRTVVTLVVE